LPTTPLESALIEVLIPENLKLFGMNTYKKYRGGGGLIVNQIPDEGICPEEHRDEGSLFKRAAAGRVTNH
jgi:hypothetical protein